MIENTLIILCLSYTCISLMFIVSLYISRYFNSPRLFYFISIVSSISMMFIFVAVKLQSSWFVRNPHLAYLFSMFNITSSLKYLELAFGYKWTYIRQMPLKLIIMYFLAFPRMSESEVKLSRQNVRRESMLSILRGICQFIILRIVIYLISPQWLSLPSSLFSPIFRIFRCGLLSILLYLFIDGVTGIGFGIYSFVFNLHMNSVFHSFPFISTSLRDFWSHHWNNLIKSSLHLISFIVLPKLINPMNNTARAFFAFALSGFMHECALWFASDKWFGKNMIFFLIHAFLVLLEITFKLPTKPNTLKGKFLGWMWTIGVMSITSPLFFDPMIDAGIFSNIK